MVSPSQDRLLTVKDVAELLNVGKSTVWAWAEIGRLPQPVRLGGRCTRWWHSQVLEAVAQVWK